MNIANPGLLAPKVQDMSGNFIEVTTALDFMTLNDGPDSLGFLVGQFDIRGSGVDSSPLSMTSEVRVSQ